MKNYIILLILGLTAWFVYKKGKTATAAAPVGFFSTMRSGLFSTAATVAGVIPGASSLIGSTTTPTTTPTTPTLVGSSGGGDNNTGGGGSYDDGGATNPVTTEQPYFTRDLTRRTPFVNL